MCLLCSFTSFDAAEPIRVWLVQVCVALDVAVTTCVGATCAMLIGAVGILEASATLAMIANVCTLLEGPVLVWVRQRPMLASGIQTLSNRVIPFRTVA